MSSIPCRPVYHSNMDNFPRYPDIVLVKNRPEIFAVKEVRATEKLHGSSFRLNFPAGMQGIQDIRFGSREVEDGPGISFPLGGAKAMLLGQPELLTRMMEVIKAYGFSDVTVFGEAYGPGIKTKGVKYSLGMTMLFRAFDIMIGENLVTDDLFREITEEMNLPRVHEVWRGPPSMEAFDALLEKPSVEGILNGIKDPNNRAEGVVIRSNPLLRDVFGKWLICKHKAAKFREDAEAPAIKAPRDTTPEETFAQTHVTSGRIRKPPPFRNRRPQKARAPEGRANRASPVPRSQVTKIVPHMLKGALSLIERALSVHHCRRMRTSS